MRVLDSSGDAVSINITNLTLDLENGLVMVTDDGDRIELGFEGDLLYEEIKRSVNRQYSGGFERIIDSLNDGLE